MHFQIRFSLFHLADKKEQRDFSLQYDLSGHSDCGILQYTKENITLEALKLEAVSQGQGKVKMLLCHS